MKNLIYITLLMSLITLTGCSITHNDVQEYANNITQETNRQKQVIIILPYGLQVIASGVQDNDIDQWIIDNINPKINTVGTTRYYTRPDGKEISVTGGTYGWLCDSAKLKELIINANDSDAINLPMQQTAQEWNGINCSDWSTFIDIDITEQKVRYYDNNTLQLEADCVTGNPKLGNDTPEGAYFIVKKSMNEVLQGPIIKGKPKWKNKVTYWMPFIDNSIGCHDSSSWRSKWGGNIYKTNGSHGCVNMSYKDAKALYELIDIGCPVIVHY